jgi:hypothetical protein
MIGTENQGQYQVVAVDLFDHVDASEIIRFVNPGSNLGIILIHYLALQSCDLETAILRLTSNVD